MSVWPADKPSPKVCIIGAGPSGLATARRLLEAGIRNLSIVERQGDVGGNWTWGDRAAHSSLYETVRSISSRDMTAFQGVPFSSSVNTYPTRTDLLHYLQRMATHFDLHRHIRFNTQVVSVAPLTTGWSVVTEGQVPENFDAVCVCSGHHWNPAYPDLPGNFSGRIVHAHDYRNSSRFAEEHVLVIGCGNSGADIAVDLARRGCKVSLSIRRGYHIVPRFLFGMASDVLYSRLRRFVPLPLLRPVAQALLTAHRRYQIGGALPTPDHNLFATHPLVNSELIPCIRSGGIRVVGPVADIHGQQVRFSPFHPRSSPAGAAMLHFDTIIACTGYKVAFPFLASSITGTTSEQLLARLQLRLVHKDQPGLYFVGLLQPSGSLWPVADAQAKFIAAHLAGAVQPPSVEPSATRTTDRYVPSARHLLEVDGEDYERTLLALASAHRSHATGQAQ
jgi:hypothetical protein